MIKCATAYIARDSGRAIVAVWHQNQFGILYEGDETSVVEAPEAESLGAAVMRALGQSRARPKDLRTLVPTDLPAYRASGCKSLSAFKRSCLCVSVTAANDANLIAIVEGSPDETAELTVKTAVSMHAAPAEMGRLMLAVFAACRDRKL